MPIIKIDALGVGKIAGVAFIEPAKCHGCGICASECPAQAIELMHFRHAEVESKFDALLAAEEVTA